MKSSTKRAFSLLELSVVILIVGILIAGVSLGNKIVLGSKLAAAQTLTQNSPVNDTPNLLLWYETSLPSSFIPTEILDNATTATTISTWYDNSSQLVNRNNATQPTLTNRPTFVRNVFNGGIPGIRFDGVDNVMSYDGRALGDSSNYTIFVVEQRRSSNNDNYFIGGSDNNVRRNLILGWRNNTMVTQAHYGADMNYTNAALAYTGTPIARIHTFRFTSGTMTYWYNGGVNVDQTQAQPGLLSNIGSTIGSFAGAPFFYLGDIAEIIYYTRSLKTTERQAIEAYLSKKYNIPIS